MRLATFQLLDTEPPKELERKCAFKYLGVVTQIIEREILERQETINLTAKLEYLGRKWRKTGNNIMDDLNLHSENIIQEFDRQVRSQKK